MKPVFQTITEVDPLRGICGNCFQAVIASILELPLDDVPHFAQLALEREVGRGVPLAEAWKGGTDWWFMLNDWLAPRGLFYIEFPDADKWDAQITERLGFHVMVGPSPRGDYDHCVVGNGGKLVHDPRAGSTEGLRALKSFGVFIQHNPASSSPTPDTLSASEGIYGFAGWLTSRKERVVMSGHDDAARIAELVNEFCIVNKLAPPREQWERVLVHPKEKGKE